MDVFSNIIILITLALMVVLLTRADKKIHGTNYTPFIILAVPYTILVFLSFPVSYLLDFVYLYIPSVMIWIVCLLVFWLGGKSAVMFFNDNANADHTPDIRDLKPPMIIVLLSLLIIAIMSFRLYQCIGIFGIMEIGSDDFTKAYAGRGFYGHTYVLAMCLFVYWIAVSSFKKVYTLVFLLVFFIILFVYQVKGWIMLSIFTGLFYCLITKKIKLSVKFIAYTLLFSILIFCSTYYIQIIITQQNHVENSFYYIHLGKYIYAGILGYSEYIQSFNSVGNNHFLVTATIENIFNIINGLPMVDVINHVYLYLDKNLIESTNVNNIFGTMHIALGYPLTVMISYIVGFFMYCFYYSIKNIWSILLYSFVLSILFLGWFDSYFPLMTFYEVFIYLSVFSLINVLFRRKAV